MGHIICSLSSFWQQWIFWQFFLHHRWLSASQITPAAQINSLIWGGLYFLWSVSSYPCSFVSFSLVCLYPRILAHLFVYILVFLHIYMYVCTLVYFAMSVSSYLNWWTRHWIPLRERWCKYYEHRYASLSQLTMMRMMSPCVNSIAQLMSKGCCLTIIATNC